MNAESRPPQPRNQRRWNLSLSLRMALVLVLFVGTILGLWARKAHLQQRTVERVTQAGGHVFYDYEGVDAGWMTSTSIRERSARRKTQASVGADEDHDTSATSLTWVDGLRTTIGVDFLHHVVGVIASHTELDKADYALLSKLDRLEELNLCWSTVDDEDLARFRGLTRLKVLYLTGNSITDEGLVHLKNLKQLEELDLDSCRDITDAGLIHLQGLKNLRVLALQRTGVTDEGLRHLEGLTNLQVLFAQRPRVTPEGVRRLQEALPGLRVHY